MLTPIERYHRALYTEGFFSNPAQLAIIEKMQVLYQQLQERHTVIKKWLKKSANPKGLYIWGSVGIGKTWLMDLFYDSLPFKQKWRCHLHDFMLQIQDELQRFQGQADPLAKIAKKIALKTKILCFDEFLVNNIADAMIMGNLFQALFREKIIVVATSNVPPDNLYAKGLQRERFLPTIGVLKKHLDIAHLEISEDYRLRPLTQAAVYFSCLSSEDTNTRLEALFQQLAKGNCRKTRDIYLYERPLETIAYADNIIWFDFMALCHIPRSQADYLSIARRWPIVMISNVRQIRADETTIARYFINLIDILYDLHSMLILASPVSITDIYPEGELAFEFQRTQSRLLEMQSTDYLAKTQCPLNN